MSNKNQQNRESRETQTPESKPQVQVRPQAQAQKEAETQTSRDLEGVDMGDDKPFHQKYPQDLPISDLHARKQDSLNRLYDQRKKEFGNNFNPVKETSQLEEQFRRVEMADVDLLDFAARKERLAQQFETMGLIQAIEAVSALLMGTNVPGQNNASKKMAAAVRILKEENGIPADADSMKNPPAA